MSDIYLLMTEMSDALIGIQIVWLHCFYNGLDKFGQVFWVSYKLLIAHFSL